jgi:hypothetical protein
LGHVSEVVEQDDAVGLGPYADGAGASNVIVVGVDIGLAVQRHADMPAGKLDPQRMPRSAGDRRVDILDGDAPARLRVVERDIVFQRIGARDIVVAAILPAPDDSCRLVFGARKRLEAHFDMAIGKRAVPPDAPGKIAAAALLQYVRFRRGAGLRFDAPPMSALTGDAGNPVRRELADRVGVEVECFRHGDTAPELNAENREARAKRRTVHGAGLPPGSTGVRQSHLPEPVPMRC